MSDQVHYLSAESLEGLKVELDEMENKTIPDIARRIDEAKQQGDLSENAEYHQAREDMSWARSRLVELEQLINNAKVIEKQCDNNVVSVGCSVKIKTNNKERVFTIVGPQEVDVSKGYISNESPIGEALMKHAVGDEVDITTPAGTQTYKILEVK